MDIEIAELQAELEKYTKADDKIADIMDNIIEIAGNAGKILKSLNTQQKRTLLKLILSNSTIEGKKAWISLKKRSIYC